MKLNQMVFYGSHDSGAYTADFKGGKGNKILSLPIIKSFAKRWSITQKKDIYNQLLVGARYLDLRISKYDNDFYTSHSICCAKMNNILSDILKFLGENRKCLLLIEVTEKDNINKEELYEYLLSKLGHLLFKNINTFDIDIQTILEAKKQIILFYPEPLDSYCWNSNKIVGTWINTNDIETKQRELIKQLRNYTKNNQTVFHFAYTLSPNTKNIIGSIFTKSSLLKLADKINSTFSNFYNFNLTETERDKITIVTFDNF
jgi:hypothetical protein